jgi:hypothetical protein
MSTIFGILKEQGKIILEDDCLPTFYRESDFEVVAFRGNGRNGMRWENIVAKYLPPETPVYPLDNSAQGIYTIGDIINEIKNQ